MLKTLLRFHNIKFLLPGSDLHKLKDKNNQLVKDITLISLHLNMPVVIKEDAVYKSPRLLKKVKTLESARRVEVDVDISVMKKSLSQPSKKASEAFDLSLDDPILSKQTSLVESPASPENSQQKPKMPAFRIQYLIHPKILAKCNRDKAIEQDECYWNDSNSCEFKVERLNYLFLTENIIPRISKTHAIITGKRLSESELLRDFATQDDQDPSQTLPPLWTFELEDGSLNGTFILKASDSDFPTKASNGKAVDGEFEKITNGNKVELNNGDIVGVVLNKPEYQQLLFGFQFFCELE